MNRTNIFASLRFVMIFYIVQGHFLQVATGHPFWLALFKQHNAVVGCFFLLSGFLLSFMHKPESKPAQFWPFIKKRLQRIYPVYFAVLLIFLPMFLAVDFHYGATVYLEIKRAIICFSLLQAWHPDWGLLWNSPTWFLSSLVFCYASFPLIMPAIQGLSKKILWGLTISTFGILVGIKLAYSITNGFFFLEGLVEPKPIPYFNFLRFFPPINMMEFMLGTLVGLIASKAENRPSLVTAYVPVLTLITIAMVILVRVYAPLNDMLARTIIFTPLFLVFLYAVRFGNGKYLGVFETSWFKFLGEISFSLYCIHGALGQLFYKKAVKVMLKMPDVPYALYLALLFVMATALYYGIEQRFAITMPKQKKRQ